MKKKKKASTVRSRKIKSVWQLDKFSKEKKKTSKHQQTHTSTMIFFFISFHHVDSKALKTNFCKVSKLYSY